MQKKHSGIFVILSAIYTLALFLTPVNHAELAKYHLSVRQDRVLDVLIVIPLYLIWGAAFYGFSVFHRYTQTIKRSKDGAAFRSIVYGLMALAIGSPLISDITALINTYTSRHLQDTPKQVIVGNYLTVALTVLALCLIYRGAVQLCQLTRKRFSASGSLLYNLVFIALAGLYTCVFVRHLPSAQHVRLTAVSHAAYYSPDWVIFSLLLIPYLIAWYLGLLAVGLLRFYRHNIGAPIYTQALRYLSYGIAIVVSVSIVEQVITIMSGQLQNLSTAVLLLIIYLLLLVIASGFVTIAVGAKKLTTIEKV